MLVIDYLNKQTICEESINGIKFMLEDENINEYDQLTPNIKEKIDKWVYSI